MMEERRSTESVDQALLALASASSTAGPIWLHLLVADRCNHSCEHCYQVQGLKGELSSEQIENVLRDFRAAGGFVVTFSGGEATLRDDLIRLLSYSHELGLATVLYTNGFTMTQELARSIATCHVWRVEISVYSHRAAEHDAATRVAGSWAKTVQGVRWLRASKVNVILKFTPTARSSASASEMAAFARELGANLLIGELVNAGEGGRTEPADARRQPEAAIANLADAPAGQDHSLRGRPCGAGDQLTIRSDGRVQPCTQLQVSMGQIGLHGERVEEGAAAEVARFFREVTWGDFPGCRECDLRVHCRRCFASAAAEVGDMLAPYRGACELAVARYRKVSGKTGQIVGHSSVERGATLGPYRLDESGDLHRTKQQHSAYDQALVDRYPWLRPSREALQSSACGASATHQERGLIQLRRAIRR